MPDESVNKSQLIEIFQRIDEKINAILELVKIFREEHGSVLKPETQIDIQKVQQGALSLRQELQRFTTENFPSDKQMVYIYLSKIRHDLYNQINAVQGYSELVLEEFETSNPTFVELFRKITNNILYILKLIDSIRLSQSSPSLNRVLPAAQAGSSEKNKIVLPSQISSKEEEYRQFKEKFSILIVDDNEENCQLLQRYLKRIGFANTQIAHDGYQALAMKDRADLMLLDIDMNEMSGIDVLMSIKEDIIQGRIRVLMISASDTMENTIECIKFGADDFLTKPFNPDLLQVRIDSCIEKKWAVIQQNIYREKLKFERRRYEKLLNAVFPSAIVEELANHGKVQAAYYKNVAVLFADVVEFTKYCDTHEPIEIIYNLQEFAGLCESIAIKNQVQKIKTIGDCFLGVSGMLATSENPVLDCINFARELQSSLELLSAKWQVRIGINYGTVIGGIVGHRQYLFDIWGDTVNTTSRIQTLAKPNQICLSKGAWEQIKEISRGESLGEQKVKGKDPFEIFSYQGKGN